MKIIKNNNVNENITEEYICENCNSVFEYDKDDIKKIGDENIVFCPCCNNICYVGSNENKMVKFPQDYHCFRYGVDVCSSDIDKIIKESIDFFKNNPNETFRYVASGNTFCCVFNHEDEYYIIVAKDYFDSCIDK